MALEKYTAYRNIPFSSETPSDRHHTFVTVTELVKKLAENKNQVFLCRAVGTIRNVGQPIYFHEIEDSTVKVPLSLEYARTKPPFLTLPYAVHLSGFAHWKPPHGAVIFAQTICAIPPHLALRIRSTMRWALDSLYCPVDLNNVTDPVFAQAVVNHHRHLAVRWAEDAERASGARQVLLPPDIPMCSPDL